MLRRRPRTARLRSLPNRPIRALPLLFPTLVALPRHIDLPGALKRLHDINADLITTLQRSATAAAGSCGETTSQSDASDKQFSFGAYCLMNWVDTRSAGFVSTDEGSVVNAAASLEVVQGLLWRMDRNEVLNAGEGEETPTSDLFGLEPIWRVWLELICIGCGSGDLIGGVEWILMPWSSWSASVSN